VIDLVYMHRLLLDSQQVLPHNKKMHQSNSVRVIRDILFVVVVKEANVEDPGKKTDRSLCVRLFPVVVLRTVINQIKKTETPVVDVRMMDREHVNPDA
jgi:hypothetical protein